MINGVTEMRVKVEGGYIIATASCDPEYPGIDVEFEPDNSDKESERLSNPRVLLENPSVRIFEPFCGRILRRKITHRKFVSSKEFRILNAAKSMQHRH